MLIPIIHGIFYREMESLDNLFLYLLGKRASVQYNEVFFLLSVKNPASWDRIILGSQFFGQALKPAFFFEDLPFMPVGEGAVYRDIGTVGIFRYLSKDCKETVLVAPEDADLRLLKLFCSHRVELYRCLAVVHRLFLRKSIEELVNQPGRLFLTGYFVHWCSKWIIPVIEGPLYGGIVA